MGLRQSGPTASRPVFRLVQVLRAVAALMVVAHHATILLQERNHLPIPTWIAGSSGVDIFFVISGFVMTLSAAPLRSVAHPGRIFLLRRLERIVPLYWLVTTAKVLLLLALPALALNGLGSWQHVLASYFFVPWLSAEMRFEPVVIVGWTLNFELAFYLLFATCLARRWRPLFVVGPVLLLLPWTPWGWLTALPYSFHFYVSTVLWEFMLGMLLGTCVRGVRRWPAWTGVVLLLGGFVPLTTWYAPGLSYWRGAMWGLPAAAVVTGAVVLEDVWGRRSPHWALALGDASYSVYLIHTFVLPVIGLWLVHWAHHWSGEVSTALAACVVLSALAGGAAYRWLERPLLRWFHGRRHPAVPVTG